MPSRSEVASTYVKVFPNPAAGAEISITPSGLGFWRILSLVFTLTTSAVVANRAPSLAASDGTSRYWRSGAVAVLAASLAGDWSAFPGSTAAGSANGVTHLAFPEGGLLLPPGYRLTTVTAGIDVADQYSAVAALVEELLTGEGSTIDLPYFGSPIVAPGS